MNNDAALGLAGLPDGGQRACTMEQLNKNPVTDTFVDFGGPPGASAFVTSSFNTCQSTWDAPTRCSADQPDVTGRGMPAMASPTRRHWRTRIPTIGSLSNFRSDHPGGGLFLLCDGSVQFLSENIDMSIYTGLSTIQGGETVSGSVGEP